MHLMKATGQFRRGRAAKIAYHKFAKRITEDRQTPQVVEVSGGHPIQSGKMRIIGFVYQMCLQDAMCAGRKSSETKTSALTEHTGWNRDPGYSTTGIA